MTTALPLFPGRRQSPLWRMLQRASAALAGSSGPPPPAGRPAIDELYHARRLSLVRLAVLMVDDQAPVSATGQPEPVITAAPGS